MLSDRYQGMQAIHQFLQLALVQFTFWICFLLNGVLSDQRLFSGGVRYGAFAFVACMALLAYRGATGAPRLNILRIGWIQNIFDTAGLVVWVIGSYLLLLCANQSAGISRTFAISFFIALYPVILIGNRICLRPLVAFLFGERKELTLLIGPKPDHAPFKEWLADRRQFGLRDMEFAEPGFALSPGESLPSLETVGLAVESTAIRQILVGELPNEPHWIRGLVQFCNRRGIRLIIVNTLPEQIGHSLTMCNHNGAHLITLRDEPLENPFNRTIKRAADIVVGATGLAIAMPILIPIVWVLHQWQSPGQLFFWQRRRGLRNDSFRMLKFRTMHASNDDESKQATLGDKRIFPAGRFLRKFSLDEFPQLWNVLKGEMSIVGPRPHLAEHNEAFERVLASYNVRSLIRPGVTGLAQVRGHRGEIKTPEDVEKRVNSDIYYIENWSLSLDFLILLRTALNLLRPPRSAV
jgi:exopolysaccharide biosynthesis polyprenyl glycosylphosphotransferase